MGKIINDLEGFFPKVCSLTPPPSPSNTVKHKRVSVTIVCTTPSSSGKVGGGGGGGVCATNQIFKKGGGGGGGGGGVEPPTKFSKREGAS